MAGSNYAARDGEVLQTIARLMAPYVREHLQPNTETERRYYSQADSPLGRRQHLALVRRGLLRGKKVGRSVFVLAADVHAFIEAHAPESVQHGGDAEDELNAWGLVTKGRK